MIAKLVTQNKSYSNVIDMHIINLKRLEESKAGYKKYSEENEAEILTLNKQKRDMAAEKQILNEENKA